MATGDQWSMCNCCGRGPAAPPYSGYGVYGGAYDYYNDDRPSGPCDCCGGDSVVLIVTDASNPPEPRRQPYPFGDGSCPLCANNLPNWAELIGQSLPLVLCAFQCSDVESWRTYAGCKAFPVKFKSVWHQRGAPSAFCDRMGTLYLAAKVTCAREYAGTPGVFTDRRSIHVRMGYTIKPGDHSSCGVYGDCDDLVATWLDADGCGAEINDGAAACADPPPLSGPIVPRPNQSAMICASGCNGAVSFDLPRNSGIDEGIFGFLVAM